MATVHRSADGMPESDLQKAVDACRGSFLAAGFFSLFVNLLLLLPAIYMLQIYDRVLTSGSQATLAMLTLIAVFLFIVMGGLEWVRSQIMVVAGTRLDRLLAPRVFDSVFTQSLATGGRISSAQPLGDLLQLRQFLTGPGLFAFFDAPWLPIYVIVMFLFHPLFGIAAIVAAIALLGLTVWNELSTRDDLKEANRHSMEASNQTQRNLRNAEVIEAMGMLPRVRERWQHKQESMLSLQARASRRGGLITSISRTFRITVQTLVLGLGAYLAIRREITPGMVIAGSILLGRALAPLDQLVGTWRGFIGARDAYHRLDEVLAGARGADAASGARRRARARQAGRRAAGRTRTGDQERQPRDRARNDAGRHRSERGGQVHAGARDAGHLQAVLGVRATRRRGARAVGAYGARPARRLPAAGRRTARRHREREHRPLRRG